ncbi:MAG: hypothetical protein RL120_15015, partial [Gammaproteobacteria bacterium]
MAAMTPLKSTKKISQLFVFIGLFFISAGLAQAQDGAIPRSADGRPDFNGIWQALGTAHYDIEPHAADFG